MKNGERGGRVVNAGGKEKEKRSSWEGQVENGSQGGREGWGSGGGGVGGGEYGGSGKRERTHAPDPLLMMPDGQKGNLRGTAARVSVHASPAELPLNTPPAATEEHTCGNPFFFLVLSSSAVRYRNVRVPERSPSEPIIRPAQGRGLNRIPVWKPSPEDFIG